MGAQGTTTIDFGAFPGSSDTSVSVVGQAGIVSGSLVEAWIRPEATADHSADEHMVETIKVVAGNIVAGVGFTIYAFNTSQINEPNTIAPLGRFSGAGQYAGPGKQDIQVIGNDGKGTRIYGVWTVAWVWN